MVEYLSAHHSEDDPGGLIGQALEMGDAFPGPAEDLVLSWSLRLENPAAAARHLIARHGLERPPTCGGPRGRLIELLQETARSEQAAPARRRGGRKARVMGG